MHQPAVGDTPIHRVAVNTLAVIDLEERLERLRERRLVARQAVETAAKVTTEKANLKAELRFQGLLGKAQKALETLEEKHNEMNATVNRLRALIIEIGE